MTSDDVGWSGRRFEIDVTHGSRRNDARLMLLTRHRFRG